MPQRGKSLTDAENEELFHEVTSMMHEGDEDEDRRELSSDEEGYVDGLIDGQTARAVHRGSAAAPPAPNTARRDSVAASGGQSFQSRQAALFAAFDTLQPGLAGDSPFGSGARIGPARRGATCGRSTRSRCAMSTCATAGPP